LISTSNVEEDNPALRLLVATTFFVRYVVTA
jgi:hypothetical protein